jgi:hypothetical protein
MIRHRTHSAARELFVPKRRAIEWIREEKQQALEALADLLREATEDPMRDLPKEGGHDDSTGNR